MLESYQHEASFFVTLTKRQEVEDGRGCVSVREGQLFLKRLRRHVEPARLRYYLVGEYGERTGRPHYHAALFGLRDYMAVEACWGFGHVHIGTLTPKSAHYLAGYISKGLTYAGHQGLQGRCPEFARRSLKPGLGRDAVGVIAAAAAQGEVLPKVVRVEKEKMPLGRYLQSKIQEVDGLAVSENARQWDYLLSESRWSELAGELDRQSRDQARLVAEQRLVNQKLRRDL